MFEEFADAPFQLDEVAIAWVRDTFYTLNDDQKIGQLLLPLARDLDERALAPFVALQVGGVHRLPSRSRDQLRSSAEHLQRTANIPMFLSCDIEFSEKGSFLDGSLVTSQMGAAATNDMVWIERMARIAAREGTARGFNWSFTPVIDLDLNPRGSVVNTRAFGDDPDRVASASRIYIQTLQAEGMAACGKHFPGDGRDERDQHYVTSRNDLDAATWTETYGKVFRDVIEAGVKTIMVGHITLPGVPGAALVPASLNPTLLGMLRDDLGFKGVTISDACGMGGFLAAGPRSETVPQCVAAGCDVLLFPENLEEDFQHLKEALADGRLTRARLDQAVRRILALKASQGLHRGFALPPLDADADTENRRWSIEMAQASITLVRDRDGILPLQPARNPRLLVLQPATRFSPSGPLPQLAIAEKLADEGFDVRVHLAGEPIDLESFDVAIYLIAEEGLSGKQGLRPDWTGIHGRFPASMTRLWRMKPALMVSLGSPYHLYDAPDCPALINAYSAVQSVQTAVVDALVGRISMTGVSPVDPMKGV